MVADQQPGHSHGHRAADVQPTRERVAAHDHGESDHHLGLVFVDRAHRAIGDPAEERARAASRRRPRRGTGARPGRSENGSVPSAAASRMANTTTPTPSLNRLSPATVALSVGETAVRWRMPITATGSVGGRSARRRPCTTGAAGRGRGHKSEDRSHAADEHGRKQHADRAEHKDRPAAAVHLDPIDVQRTGEEQKRRSIPSIRVAWKSIPARNATVCSPTWLAGRRRSMPMTIREAERAHDGEADRRGQADEAMVQVSSTAARTMRIAAASKRGSTRRWCIMALSQAGAAL